MICCPLRELKPIQKIMNKSRLSLLTVMILAATAARLIPHPPNFSPIAAMALFGGAAFADGQAGMTLAADAQGRIALADRTKNVVRFFELKERAQA